MVCASGCVGDRMVGNMWRDELSIGIVLGDL